MKIFALHYAFNKPLRKRNRNTIVMKLYMLIFVYIDCLKNNWEVSVIKYHLVKCYCVFGFADLEDEKMR